MDLEECKKYIDAWYLSDTIELLDLVLSDSVTDPQYSAITTLNRFWVYLQYKNYTDKDYVCRDVSKLLTNLGYSLEDLAQFKEKVKAEKEVYTADILDVHFA